MPELTISQVENGWIVQSPDDYGVYVFTSHWDMSKFIEGFFAKAKTSCCGDCGCTE